MNENKNSGTGALVASIIIVLILIVGGYYSFKNRPLKLENVGPSTEMIEIQPSTQQTSTELDDFPLGTESANPDSITSELNSAEQMPNQQ